MTFYIIFTFKISKHFLDQMTKTKNQFQDLLFLNQSKSKNKLNKYFEIQSVFICNLIRNGRFFSD